MNQKNFKQPLKEPIRFCTCCGEKPVVAKLDMMLAVGFGTCVVTKNGEVVYDEIELPQPPTWEDFPLLQEYENLAKKEPEADWRVQFIAPLYEAEYQRQGEDNWVLINKGEGFA